MRKLLLLLFIPICFITLVACQANNGINNSDNPYFTGKVTEIYNESCLVEVTNTGNGNFEIGNTVQIHTRISNCPSFDAGDYLIITFDGKVAYSYPPQIPNVLSISKVENTDF